jgi:DNA polymerase V
MSHQATVVEVFTPDKGQGGTIQLFSSAPAAGFPAPGDDFVEVSLNIHDLMVKHPDSTFFVRVEGDSMEGAGIFSGDVLVIDRQVDPSHGSIVVAALQGGLVVKRLKKEDDQIFLVSENPAFLPIKVGESEECFIWGVVTGSLRQF